MNSGVMNTTNRIFLFLFLYGTTKWADANLFCLFACCPPPPWIGRKESIVTLHSVLLRVKQYFSQSTFHNICSFPDNISSINDTSKGKQVQRRQYCNGKRQCAITIWLQRCKAITLVWLVLNFARKGRNGLVTTNSLPYFTETPIKTIFLLLVASVYIPFFSVEKVQEKLFTNALLSCSKGERWKQWDHEQISEAQTGCRKLQGFSKT